MPVGGSATVLSTGVIYGSTCLGNEFMENLLGQGCSNVGIEKTFVTTGNLTTTTGYKIFFQSTTPNSKQLLLLSFSQTLSTNDITILSQVTNDYVFFSNHDLYGSISQEYNEVLPTNSSTSLVLIIDMPAYALPWYEVNIVVNTPTDQTLGLCITESLCGACTDTNNCTSTVDSLKENMFVEHNLTRYESTIEYRCPPGQMFWNGSELLDSVLLGCNVWSNATNAITTLPSCEGKVKQKQCKNKYNFVIFIFKLMFQFPLVSIHHYLLQPWTWTLFTMAALQYNLESCWPTDANRAITLIIIWPRMSFSYSVCQVAQVLGKAKRFHNVFHQLV